MKHFRKYGKWLLIFVLAVVVSASLGAAGMLNPAKVSAGETEGCSVTWFVTHTDEWGDWFSPDDPVRYMFGDAALYDLGDITLLQALTLRGGGFDYSGNRFDRFAARLLLRQGVAAGLNVAHPLVHYPVSLTEVADMVNGALASGDRNEMNEVRIQLREWNNLECPMQEEVDDNGDCGCGCGDGQWGFGQWGFGQWGDRDCGCRDAEWADRNWQGQWGDGQWGDGQWKKWTGQWGFGGQWGDRWGR